MHHDCFHHSCEQTCSSIRSGQSSCPPLQVLIPTHPPFLFPEWGLLPGLLLPKWSGQRGRHLHRAVSLLELCLQVFANPQPFPSFFRQKSGLGFSTFDGKNARLKPDKVRHSLCVISPLDPLKNRLTPWRRTQAKAEGLTSL